MLITARTLQLLVVGICLYLIAKYMQLMFATIRALDRLMMHRFFDVEGLTEEIRASAAHRHGPAPESPRQDLMRRPVYRWLCARLRKAARL